MYKLMLVFKSVEGVNIDSVEQRWSHEFVPQAEHMPGLRRVTVSRMNKPVTPEADIHLIHELHFDDVDALDAAMKSPEGQRAGRLLMDFAGESVQVYFAEHMEDRPNPIGAEDSNKLDEA